MKLQEIVNCGVNALKEAYSVQRRLLEEGTIAELVSVGRGEDKATRGDYESEEAVINYLKEQNFPGKIISEEHGTIELGNKYLAVLDGIDGSSALVKNPKTRCGTILTISKKLNPIYDDFFFSGITEYINNRVVYCDKGVGVYLMENIGKNEKEKQIPKFKEKKFSKNCVIKIDCYKTDYAEGITKGMDDFEKFMNKNVVSKLDGKMKLTGSITHDEMCIDLLLGKIDAVAHMVAKGVFEPPNLYLMTKELNGYASDLKGNLIGEKKWGPVGMNIDACIFSSSYDIGKKIISFLNE